jgi:[acyl-carrier-protein] S-malonyltransferase
MGTATAILFPGQGAQAPDMREAVERTAPQLIELIVDAVGCDPFERLDEGTRYVQPAVFCSSVAGWLAISEREQPLAFAGHSLGEIGALVAAGSLSIEDGCRLVALRAELTARVPGELGMVAVANLDEQVAEELASSLGLTLACYNAPSRVVISGEARALGVARDRVDQLGGRSVPLAITGAFHSPLLEVVAPDYRAALDGIQFGSPSAPVLSCLDGEPFSDPRRQLVESLTRPVRWTRVLTSLACMGVDRFLQVPPGRGLCKTVTATLPRKSVAEVLAA